MRIQVTQYFSIAAVIRKCIADNNCKGVEVEKIVEAVKATDSEYNTIMIYKVLLRLLQESVLSAVTESPLIVSSLVDPPRDAG